MQVQRAETTEGAARLAADVVCRHAEEAIEGRGRFHLALSGGRGPEPLFRELAGRRLAWDRVVLYQVDERVAPAGHEDRNLELIRSSFSPVLSRLGGVHPMPVEDDDLDAAARQYASVLAGAVGSPPVLDLVHLGVGPDGHTASLVPGQAVLDVADRPVAVTDAYQGRRRMTLTFPALDAARHRLWYVTDRAKGDVVRRLLAGDATIPAGRVRSSDTTLVASSDVLGDDPQG